MDSNHSHTTTATRRLMVTIPRVSSKPSFWITFRLVVHF